MNNCSYSSVKEMSTMLRRTSGKVGFGLHGSSQTASLSTVAAPTTPLANNPAASQAPRGTCGHHEDGRDRSCENDDF